MTMMDGIGDVGEIDQVTYTIRMMIILANMYMYVYIIIFMYIYLFCIKHIFIQI